MKILRTIEEVISWKKTLPPSSSLGFVPTMGALHSGHAQLLKESAAQHSHTLLSIYVNPTQFGPQEDLAKYPRSFESDCTLAEEIGASAVFAPTNEVLYPDDFSTYVTEESISIPLCGKFRPGHFRGVATIVLKLFNIVQPQSAYFGLKDIQQYLVIKRMVRDLNLNINIVGVPTVREASGLALSSRNIYLSDTDRIHLAPNLYKVLHFAKNELIKGMTPQSVIREAIKVLESKGFKVQYFELRKIQNLENLSGMKHSIESSVLDSSLLLACAAFLPSRDQGTVRLIDNLIF